MILSLGQSGCRGQRWGLLSPPSALASREGPQTPWALSWRGGGGGGSTGPWTQCGPLLPLPLPLGSTGQVQGGGAMCPGPRPSVRQGGRVSLVFSSPAGGPGCNTLLGYLQPPTLDVPFPGVIESRVWRPPPQFAAVEIRIQFLSPQSPIPPSLWEPTDPGVGVPAPATPTSGADVWPEIREPTSVSCGKS